MTDLLTTTPFQIIYTRFLSKITDDMYLEWTQEDTYNDLKNILLTAIPKFEFPKFRLYDYDSETDVTDALEAVVSQGLFNSKLKEDEIEILASLMFIEWINRQMATIEVTRMKYSSSDFKFTSQASHLNALLKMKLEFGAENRHSQKLYNRRKTVDGYVKTNYSGFGGGVL